MSLVSLPTELYSRIFSNLNEKDLCWLPLVSKGVNDAFSNDEFWRSLFFYKFPNETLIENEQAKKQFRARVNPIPVTSEDKLTNILTSFICNLKWNKKRELICTFPDEPTYFLKFSQSFGPVRGTKEGSKGNADEAEYYKYIGNAEETETKKLLEDPSYKTSTAAKNFVHEEFNQCPRPPRNKILGENLDPLEKNGVPLSITTIRVCRPCSYSSNGTPEIGLTHGYENGKITDVDLGFGNTLGYFSEINDWKHPFKLFCITDSDSNKPVWVGLIPLYVEFKFVSIDTNGAVTWERNIGKTWERTGYHRNGNRFVDKSEPLHHDLASNLLQNPIRFS